MLKVKIEKLTKILGGKKGWEKKKVEWKDDKKQG